MTSDEFEKEMEQELKMLPPEFRSTVYTIAWDQAHAYGYDDILSLTKDIVFGLVESITNYTDRIKS